MGQCTARPPDDIGEHGIHIAIQGCRCNPAGMSDISITDKDSLKAFLDEVEEPRRQHAAVFIAARAALRVAPVLYGLFEFSGEGDDWPSLLDLRSLLISSVAAPCHPMI